MIEILVQFSQLVFTNLTEILFFHSTVCALSVLPPDLEALRKMPVLLQRLHQDVELLLDVLVLEDVVVVVVAHLEREKLRYK